MKQFILLILITLLFGCDVQPKEIYEAEIKTYVISKKVMKLHSGSGFSRDYYYMYFQTPTSTEHSEVNLETYNNYEIGDTIQVLIKYWEKPKKK